MPPIIRKAEDTDARAVHEILCRISWISEATKSEDGFHKIMESCKRGEVWIVEVERIVLATMILRRYGYNTLTIPIMATVESARRRGYARQLTQKAKTIAQSYNNTSIEAYVENEKSLNLLSSEGFTRLGDRVDVSGHPLYCWNST